MNPGHLGGKLLAMGTAWHTGVFIQSVMVKMNISEMPRSNIQISLSESDVPIYA